MYSTFFKQQAGFTLVELLTVMLILVAMASVTIETASELAFQNRYEVTKDRYQKIKRAIIGRPDVLINGQPDISGFVADMGRTPEFLRDLLQAGYCESSAGAYIATPKSKVDCKIASASNEWDWAGTPCLNASVSPAIDSAHTTKSDCSAAAGHAWLGRDIDTTTNLKFGWNGPYIHTTKEADNNAALNDGWANESANDYGWIVNDTDNDGVGDDIALGQPFTIKSKGKDQAISTAGCLEYDQDCEYTIAGNQYSQDVGALTFLIKINADDNVTYDDTGSCVATGYCSDTVSVDEASCAAPRGVWTTVCSDPAYLTQIPCETANGAWVSSCTDSTHLTQAACESASETWTAVITSRRQCLFFGSTWNSVITETPDTQDVCMKIFFRVNGEVSVSAATMVESTNQYTLNNSGTIQEAGFNFSAAIIPNGINAIGIYKHNGTTCTTDLYPTGRTQTQQVVFAPNKSVDNLVW